MSDFKKEQSGERGGYENFTERGGFEDIYTTYDTETLRYFLDGAKVLIDELDMKGVSSVLDVGTGTGHLALELAKLYPECYVTGVDSSPGMLSQAELKKGKLSNVTFLQHDWEELKKLPGKYDVVTNSFGISFVKHIDKFALSVASKVESKGVFAFVNFDDGGFEPLGRELYSDLKRMSLLRKLPTQLSPANKRLIKLMESKGFKPLKIIDRKLEYPFKKPEQWWTIISRTAIKENFFYDLTENEVEMFKSEHLKSVQRLIDKGYTKYIVPITIFVGRAM